MDNQTLPPLQQAFEKWSVESGFETCGQQRGQDSYVAFSDVWAWRAWQEADRLAHADLEAEVERLKARIPDLQIAFDLAKQRADEAEAEVLRLRTGFQTATVDLVAAEARIKELEQSAEVHARNMRDLVAEHVRERDALQARIKELEQWA